MKEKILVTGGCGFIGSEVIKKLLEKGYEVTVADNLSKPESSIKEGYKFVKIDLTDKQKTEELFKGFDICVNLAAKIGGIGYFHKYPAWILSENNKIYSSTFEAAVKNKISRIVYISSSMVFENISIFPSKEKHITKIPPPSSAYGFSKLIGEWYCKAFKDQHGLNYSICRPFNAYGINEAPGEEIGYAHVIPDLVKKMISGQYPLEMLGDGEQTRCFTYVGDLAEGIVKVMESEKAVNEDFNISSPEETKMIDLAKKLWNICEMEKPFEVKFVSGFKHDVKKRIPDTSKIKELIGWEAKTKLDDGLKEVVDWLKTKI
ncbi:MAG: NAD-dependent epimerase/dehydratase family protein [Nanoarchaeota archaeon]|nr:NAD-dependent epimerase/dehydratase family protein [Nanoarchaeota archaeon]